MHNKQLEILSDMSRMLRDWLPKQEIMNLMQDNLQSALKMPKEERMKLPIILVINKTNIKTTP